MALNIKALESALDGKTPAYAGAQMSGEIPDMIARIAAEEGVGQYAPLLVGLAKRESDFDPGARNERSTAGGLFQFLDGTAKSVGLQDKFNPEENTRAAVRLFKDHLSQFGGDERLALAAHHVGAGKARQALADRGIGDVDVSTQDWLADIYGYAGQSYEGGATPAPADDNPGYGLPIDGNALGATLDRIEDDGRRQQAQARSDESPFSTSLERGWEQMGNAMGNYFDLLAGDEEGIAKRLVGWQEFDERNPMPSAEQKFMQDWTDENYLSAMMNPMGLAAGMTEQLANSLPAMAGSIPGMLAGAAAGAPFGPLGVLLGGAAGGAAGSAPGSVAIETGARLPAMMAADGVDISNAAAVQNWLITNKAAVLAEGAAKGLTVAAFDGVAGGLGSAIVMKPAVRFANAEAQIFRDLGVKSTNKAAMDVARKSPQYAAAIAPFKAELAVASTVAQNAMRGFASFAAETAGEVGGEYYGEVAATGEGNLNEALLEGVMAGGQSAVTTGAEMLGKGIIAAPEKLKNSPLTNAVNQAAAQAPATQDAASTGQQEPAQEIDPIEPRLEYVGSFVTDKDFMRAMREAPNYGKESVSEMLSAWAKAKNPNVDRTVRERAVSELEQFISAFNNRPNFTMGAQGAPSAGAMAPVPGAAPSALAPADRRAPGDDGMTLEGEVIERPARVGRQMDLGLADPEQFESRRNAEAEYDQAFQDLMKIDALERSGRALEDQQIAAMDARERLAQAEARLQEINQSLDGAQQAQSAAERRRLLDAVLANPNMVDPAAGFSAELRRQGFSDAGLTEAERARIERFNEVREAFSQPEEMVPSAPNEFDPYTPAAERPAQTRKAALSAAKIKAAIASGARLNGNALTVDGVEHELKGPLLAAARKAQEGADVGRNNGARGTPEVAAQGRSESGGDVSGGEGTGGGAGAERGAASSAGQVRADQPADGKGREGVADETADERGNDQARSEASDEGAQVDREQAPADEIASAAGGAQAEKPENQDANAQDAAVRDEPAASDPGPDDAELQDALAHLGDVLADVFPGNLKAVPGQYGAKDLLPALSKVVELLVRKGFRSFKDSVGQASKAMRGNEATAKYVDEISARRWKAAYNAIAEFHEGTDSEEQVSALSDDDVRAIINGEVPTPDVQLQAEIGRVIDAAMDASRSGNKVFATYHSVSDREAAEIERRTHIAGLSGFRHQIDESSVRHVLRRHGSAEKEAASGQVAVTRDDFLRLPQVTNPLFADSVDRGEDLADGTQTIIYRKRFDDVVYVVEEVRRGREYLALKTMWKVRAAPRATSAEGVAHTSETFGAQPPNGDSSVAPEDAGGNTSGLQADVEKAAEETNTAPTPGQKEAGNYAKGKVDLHGQRISIETPKGSQRTGKDESGKQWSVTMPAHYGYFLGTEAVDGDHVDVFIGSKPESGVFWVINQVKPGTSTYDEPKFMLGYESGDAAQADYLLSFSGAFGNQVLGSVVGPFSVADLSKMLPKMGSKSPVKGDVFFASRLGGDQHQFASYSEAQQWVEQRQKALGLSADEFIKTDEYRAIYPRIQDAYGAQQKANRNAAWLKLMNDAGLKIGDRVQTGADNGAAVLGTIIDNGGAPYVAIDGTTQQGPWSARWTKAEAPAESQKPTMARSAITARLAALKWINAVGETVGTDGANTFHFFGPGNHGVKRGQIEVNGPRGIIFNIKDLKTPGANPVTMGLFENSPENQPEKAADAEATGKESLPVESVLPDGWTESTPGGLATNPDKTAGGIVDQAIQSKTWFYVPNADGVQSRKGFETRDEAIQALADAVEPLEGEAAVVDQNAPELSDNAGSGESVDQEPVKSETPANAGDEAAAGLPDQELIKNVEPPKNWRTSWGAAQKYAEALGMSTRGENGKHMKLPELTAAIEAKLGEKPASTSGEVTSESARRAEFALSSGESARVLETAQQGEFTVYVANESYGSFKMSDDGKISAVKARANWAEGKVKEAANVFVKHQRGDQDALAFRDEALRAVEAARVADRAKDAPGTRYNTDADKAIADRLQLVHDGIEARRNEPEGGARATIRSVIEELRKPKTVSSVADMLDHAAAQLLRRFGAASRVVGEIAEQLRGEGQEASSTVAEAPPSSADLSSAEAVIANRLRKIADEVEAQSTGNGTRPADTRWAEGALKRAMDARSVTSMLGGKQYGALASAKIALGKDRLTVERVRDIADKLQRAADAARYDESNTQTGEGSGQTADDRGDKGALASVPPGQLPDAQGDREAGEGSRSGGGSDAARDGRAGETVRPERERSMDAEPGTVLPEGSDGDVVRISGEDKSLDDVAESVRNDPPASEPKPKSPPANGENPGNYRITDADAIGTGTTGERIRANMAAIRLVLKLEEDNRYPTRDEQAVLAKYVGWGGLKNVFKGDNSTSKQERDAHAELKRILTDSQYFWMGQSVLDAHYTSPTVIRSMYRVLQHFGITGGRFLEPTVGVGNFIGLMPDSMASSAKWYGAEIDPITSLIAKHLYPDSQILPATGFQDAEFAYGRMDVAIGNPPFGDQKITDRNKKRAEINGFKIHNYIIAKSAMHLRPGGVMAFVVTSRFLDTANPQARDYLAQNFRMLAAVRLPNTAFAQNAGTEVTADIIFMQRLHAGEAADTEAAWLDTKGRMLNEDGETVTLNRYFAENPEMMLGKPSMKGTMYGSRTEGGEFTLMPRPNQDIGADIEALIGDALADVKDAAKPTQADSEVEAATMTFNREDVPIGGYIVEDGSVIQRTDDDEDGNTLFRQLSADTPWTPKQALGQTRLDRIKGMLELRAMAYDLMADERADAPAEVLESKRKALNKTYDAFVDKFGFLNDNANRSLMDSDPRIEFGLERGYRKAISKAKAKSLGTDESPATAEKASLLNERVFFPKEEVDHADSPRDGYSVSLSERGRLDIDFIAKITGLSPQEVIDDLSSGDSPLIFKDPALNRWVQEDEYLSGNVKEKLRLARGAGIEANIRALEAVQPQDVAAGDIHAEFGATWIRPEIYEDFLKLLGYKAPKVSVLPKSGTVSAMHTGDPGPSVFRTDLENPDFTITDVFTMVANRRQMVAYDRVGNERVPNRERTENLGRIRNKLIAIWSDWIKSDPARSDLLARDYNEIMNTTVARKYDGVKHLKTVGANPEISLRNSQKNSAWRMIQSAVTLLDHVVGAGKTIALITGIMERKRLGLTKKAMVAVPNHLVGQWAIDWLSLYPGANILAATEKDFQAKNRKRLLARIATGNYDAVIVGHSSFGFIPVSAEAEEAFVMGEVEHLQAALLEAKEAGEKEGGRAVRTIKNRIAKRQEKIKALQDRSTDNVVTFDDMGVDYLAVDELHEFKNLEYATTLSNVAGMGSPEGSKKAFDLFMKMRILQENGGGIAGATGTPLSNSMVEMYSLLRYLNPGALDSRNIASFDSWVKAFASIEPRDEYTPSGKIKQRTVMAAFNNLPELLQLYEQVADTVTMADLKRIYADQIRTENKANGTKKREDFPVPKVSGGGRSLDMGAPTDEQIEFMDYLIARADAMEKMSGKERQDYAKIDNALWMMSDARKMSLDVRIIDPTVPDGPNSKVNRAAKRIKAIYDKWHKDRGTQLVFCDLSTPTKGADKAAAKFIESAIKGLSLDGDRALKAALTGESFEEQWKMILSRAETLMATDAYADDKREAAEEFLDKLSDDDVSALRVADAGFSVYDDLRAKLVAAGIPENEVKFIHEANTSEQKRDLFDLVNSGKVRVLIGSSAKMGAGTNVQERLVGLHHMDAPWRPSDIEQREGRIIRQRNKLYKRDPDGFEVEIVAYSTERTFDAQMWGVLARKAGFLEQFRQGNRSIKEEGSDAASYAEFMAEATGDEVFRKKIQLERELADMEAEDRSRKMQRASAADTINKADERRRRLERDLADARRLEGIDLSSVTYKNRTYKNDIYEVLDAVQEEYSEKYADYEQAMEKYAAERKAWEDASGSNRGRPPAKPEKPKYPEINSDVVRERSEWARFIDAITRDMEMMEGEREFELADANGEPVSLYARRWEKDVSLAIEDDGYALGAPRGTNVAMALTANKMQGRLRGRESGVQRDMRRLEENLAQARLTMENVEPITAEQMQEVKDAYEDVKRRVDEVTARMAFERSQRYNRFIANDTRRFKPGSNDSVRESALKEAADGYKFRMAGDAVMVAEGAQAVKVEGLPDSVKAFAYRNEDGKWYVVEESTGLSIGGGGKSAADAADIAGTKIAQVGPGKLIEVVGAANKISEDDKLGAIARLLDDGDGGSVAALRFDGDADAQVGGVVSRPDAGRIIARFVAAYPGAPRIEAVERFRQLPAWVRDSAASQGANEASTKGAYKHGNKTAYIVSSNHTSAADLEATLFHEAIGHAGFRALFGDQFVQEANRLFVALGGIDGLRQIMEKRGMGRVFDSYVKGAHSARAQNPATWTDSIVRFMLTEEVFAHTAEQQVRQSIRDRFMTLLGMVRDWLRRSGLVALADLGESDLLFMVQRARNVLKAGDGDIIRSGATVSKKEIRDADGNLIATEDDPDFGALRTAAKVLGLVEAEGGVTVFRRGDEAGQSVDVVAYRGEGRGASREDGLTYYAENRAVAESYGPNVTSKRIVMSNALDMTDPEVAKRFFMEVSPDALEDERAPSPVATMIGVEYLRAEMKQYVLDHGYDGIILPTTVSPDSMVLDDGRAFVVVDGASAGGADATDGPGNVMRQRKPIDKSNIRNAVFTALAQFDDAFQQPRPTSKDMAGIAAEIDPAFRVQEKPQGFAKLKTKGRATRAWEIFPRGQGVRSALIYEDARSRVWIDVQHLLSGVDRGNRIYGIAAGYAHNNGKVFIGDPAGLSAGGFFRRLENMISSALKYGTTDHLYPHAAQLDPAGYFEAEGEGEIAARLKGLGLDWKEGDFSHNLTEMLKASYNAATRFVPELKDVVYDFNSRQFVDAGTGARRSRRDFDALSGRVSGGKAGGYRGGSSTYARAAVYNTLVREQSREARRDLLAQIGDQLSGRGLDLELEGLFYQKGAEPAVGLTEQQFRDALTERFGEKGVQTLEESGLLNIATAEQTTPDSAAWYDPNSAQAYFVPGMMQDAEAAVAAVLHEVGEHHGLEAMLGERGWRALKDRVAQLAQSDGDVRAAWAGVLDNYPEFRGINRPQDSDRFIHEVIAKIGEQAAGRKSSLWRDVLAAVNRFLLKMGLGRQINKSELADLVEGSLKRVMAGADGGPRGDRTSPAMAQRDFSLRDYGASTEGKRSIRESIGEAIQNAFSGTSARTFNVWERTVGTQYGKARKDAHFRRVYNAAHAFVDDVSRIANEAADLARGILPHMGGLKDIAAGMNLKSAWDDSKDYEAIAKAIFDGTLADKAYTDAELAADFGLDEKQIGLYRQFRNSVDFSLESLATSEMARMARASGLLPASRTASMAQAERFYVTQIQPSIDELRSLLNDGSERSEEQITAIERNIIDLETLLGNFTGKADQIRSLQARGYAPLMRFGQYVVDVVRLDEDGNVMEQDGEPDRPFFGMFESEAEAKEAEKILAEEYPEYTVSRGVLSELANQQFKGLTPEVAELFARLLGTSESDAFQAYLKQAVANRSAMKRLIQRKGMEGFSKDVPRVLASFITSNARLASGNLHFGEMSAAIQDIPKAKGDVKDEAIKLAQYIQNPQEEAAGIRGFMFFNFLGGSIASAMVNLTQTASTTYPFLAQWGAKRAAKSIASAMAKSAKVMKDGGFDSVIDDPLRKALIRASEEGIIDPQEIHLLMAESSGADGLTGAVAGIAGKINKNAEVPVTRVGRAFMQAWGALFGAAEKYNRHVAFMAAWEMAPAGVNKYQFAKDAVVATQFDYTKSSRPNWGRGPVGATLFTFRTFMISYIEFLGRLPSRERAIAVAVLVLLSGISGLPGMEDLDDVVDTVGQKLGYNWNNKAGRHSWLVKTLGVDGANMLEHGVSSVIPLDVSARLGMGNLFPMTGLFKKSNEDKGREAAEVFGAPGSFAKNMADAIDRVGSGAPLIESALPVLPKAVTDLYKAIDMVQTGAYRDGRGRRVVDVDAIDAFIKGIGFQPNTVAEPRRVEWMLAQSSAMYRTARNEIHDLWARGVAEGNPEKVRTARERIRDWNEKNPSERIAINPASVARRVQAMRLTSADRMVKATPKDMRGALSAELEASK